MVVLECCDFNQWLHAAGIPIAIILIVLTILDLESRRHDKEDKEDAAQGA